MLVLTDRIACERRGRSLVETVRLAVDAGARAVLLREKDLDAASREALGRELLEVLTPAGGVLIVASDVALARRLGSGVVHLAARDAFPATPAGALVGRSCHTADDLQRAIADGCSYVTLSPVFDSLSKPGYGPPLGIDGLRALVARVDHPPVLALGGVTVENAPECHRAGVQGIAVMGAIMDADDPDVVTARLLGRML